MKKKSRKTMISQLVNKEYKFLAQDEVNVINRMRCKYRNMSKKLLKTYYRDNITEAIFGDDIWIDTRKGYKLFTVDRDANYEWITMIDDEDDYIQLELF